MQRAWRNWGVSGMAWLGVFALGGMALAGSVGSSEPSAWLSPDGVVEGKVLTSGEPFEMTLHFAGEPDTTYDLAVTYAGEGTGVCQADAATLETNPDGKATFECTFTTVENEGTDPVVGTVVFTVSQAEVEVASVVAALSVVPLEEEQEITPPDPVGEPEVTQAGEETGPNHGHCVSYWSHQAKAQGLSGKYKGAFVSSIARNPDAVAEKDAPGDECDFQEELTQALADQAEGQAAKAAKKASKPAKAKGKAGDGGATE